LKECLLMGFCFSAMITNNFKAKGILNN